MKPGIRIWRDANGVAHVGAEDLAGLCWGQGYAHAADRSLPLILMRILGQGRACERLADNKETLEIDRFFRRMNWSAVRADAHDQLTVAARQCLDAYCDGINARWREKLPWELRLMGVRVEPWQLGDTLMLMRMIGYLTLSQSQAEMERLLVEMVQAGIDRPRLEDLFPGLLEGLDVDLLSHVRLHERIVPPGVLWQTAAVRMMASNNWVVSGTRSATGFPLLANDVHLETNRLPNIWYEIVLETPKRCMMGGSIPGVPGVLTGRNDDLAWGVTYAFMDTIDSWIEHCREGKYYRQGQGWLDFRVRRETIVRKKHRPEDVVFYENDHGVLDGDPYREEYLLATRWAAADSGPESLNRLIDLWQASDTATGMRILCGMETDWSFVLADRDGDIGFQMCGCLPRRSHASGLVPLPGWLAENDWDGFVDPQELPRTFNPPEGYFVTANHDLNRYGTTAAINMPMGPYRADRIAHLLSADRPWTLADMGRMQIDLYSTQAEAFMERLRPLLPETEAGRILADWDLCYDVDSTGAVLFEKFYRQLCREVFGRHGAGTAVADYLAGETGVFADFYLNFDRVLLAQESAWFDGQPPSVLYRSAVDKALQGPLRTWGQIRKLKMDHILFAGRLPSFLGFDRGPYPAAGGRATICQGQIYRSAGRETSFMPSLRLVTDLSENVLQTSLAGGPSDRRFSRWYTSDLADWLSGRYKRIAPGGERLRFP